MQAASTGKGVVATSSERDWRTFAPLASVLIWTGNAIVTKAAASVIEPASITFYRWLLAFLVLAPFVGPSLWPRREVVWAHAVKLAVLGVLGMGLYQGLAYVAARTTSAVDIGVILGLMPLTTGVVAALIAGEPLSRRAIAGLLVSLVGFLIVSGKGDPLAWVHGPQWGDAIMLIAVTSNAVYGSLVRRWAIPLTVWQQLLAQIGLSLPLLAIVWFAYPITPVTAANAPLILYAGLPASIGAPLFWLIGVKRLGAARTALFINLLPFSIALAAWLLLGDRPHGYHLIGAVVALAGVALAASGARRGA